MKLARIVAPLVVAALAWLVADAARAEALPGRFEVTAGGHFMLLAHERCESRGDVVACGDLWTFAGFDLATHAQVGPSWFSLGVRASGSSALDSSRDSLSGTGLSGAGHELWLWSGSLEARFDPPIWPRALWIAAELGVVVSAWTRTSSITPFTFTGADGSETEVGGSESRDNLTKVGLLAGVAFGWDFWLADPVLFGLDARVQVLTIGERLADSQSVTIAEFPFVSLGFHVGYRW